jgi:hypothetical protein
MNYIIEKAEDFNLGDLLDNVHPEEIAIHKKYAPWISFKVAARDSAAHNSTMILRKKHGKVLAMFGMTIVGCTNIMWCIPRKGMKFYDRVAFLRMAKRYVEEKYVELGPIYVPVHKEWPAVKELVLFIGFDIVGDGDMAVYGTAPSEHGDPDDDD